MKTGIQQRLLFVSLFLFSFSALMAQRTITGVVMDNNKLPAIGVNVVIKGTTIGAITDLDGKYSIDVRSNDDILQFSMVGMTTEEIVVGDQQVINVTMAEDLMSLDEIVVVGYGVMKKSDLTGAITSLDDDEIAENKGSNAIEVMQGKVAGLDIVQSSGESGGDVEIKLRGTRSIVADNDPLILVDGVPYGTTLDINPSDIASMEVLKDASSTAIYGTRGANGVILITTKSGSAGKTKVYFNSYISVNQPTFLPEIQSGVQYAQKRFETEIANQENKLYDGYKVSLEDEEGADGIDRITEVTWKNSEENPEPWGVFGSLELSNELLGLDENQSMYEYISTDPEYLSWMNAGRNNDFIDMVISNSITDNHELGITGGNNNTAVNFSLGLMNDRGLLEGDELKRYNAKLGIDHDIIENKLKIGGDFMLTYKTHNRRNASVFNQSLKTGSIGELYDSTGAIIVEPCVYSNQINPLLDEVEGSSIRKIESDRILSSAYLNFTPIDGLVFNSNFAVDLTNKQDGIYYGPLSLAKVTTRTASTTMDHQKDWRYTWSTTLSYLKQFNEHEINLMVGNEVNVANKQRYIFSGTGQGIASTEFYDWGPILDNKPQGGSFESITSGSLYEKQQLLSYFGRALYKYKNKYIIQGTLRADGSSVLVDKWASFPSASVGWRMIEEDFIQSINVISNLKLRASWGISGTAAIDPYQTLTQVSDFLVYYTFGDEIHSSYIPYQLGVEDLVWETTENLNIGLDFGIINNRISGSVDLYTSDTEELLFNTALPKTSVYPQVISNIAATKNSGVELYLSSMNILSQDMIWNTDFTFAYNKGEIVSLASDQPEINDNEIYKAGNPVNSFYDYEYLGIYQVSDLETEIKYVQQQTSSGAAIDSSRIPMLLNDYYPGDIMLNTGSDGMLGEEDKITYNKDPKYVFGLTNYFEFKGIGLKVNVIGRLGSTFQYDFYNSYKFAQETKEHGPHIDSWTPQNTGAYFPRYMKDGLAEDRSYIRPLTYIDGSFIKVKDITLSYNLPQKMIEKIGLSSIRIYATGKNLLTFARVDNYDPERGGSMSFPLTKQYIAGINIEF